MRRRPRLRAPRRTLISGRSKTSSSYRQNYYPQTSSGRSSGAISCSARLLRGLSVEVGSEERLVLVQEVRREFRRRRAGVVEAIRERVAERHELQPYAVASSNRHHQKTRAGRSEARQRREFLAGTWRRWPVGTRLTPESWKPLSAARTRAAAKRRPR